MSVNDVIDEAQFPAWMKQARRGVDWGAVLIVGFCLIAARSFIIEAELSATNDSLAYVYRVADYADAFEQGIFYTRWSPHAVNGLGAPIPHYYPSGASYAGGLISYLFHQQCGNGCADTLCSFSDTSRKHDLHFRHTANNSTCRDGRFATLCIQSLCDGYGQLY